MRKGQASGSLQASQRQSDWLERGLSPRDSQEGRRPWAESPTTAAHKDWEVTPQIESMVLLWRKGTWRPGGPTEQISTMKAKKP